MNLFQKKKIPFFLLLILYGEIIVFYLVIYLFLMSKLI